MSSKASTTIGFERRFNPALQARARGLSRRRARPAAAAAAEHGADRRAEPRRAPRCAAAAGAGRPGARAGDRPRRAPDGRVRRRSPSRRRRHPGLAGRASRRRRAFVLPERPLVLHADGRGGGACAPSRALAGGRDLRDRGLAGGRRRRSGSSRSRSRSSSVCSPTTPSSCSTSGRRTSATTSHIPGSRHLPYRTARAAAEAGLLNGRPVVTICESGPRAAVAASVLQAAGLDARPVLDGGVATWRGETTSFRRCGGCRAPAGLAPCRHGRMSHDRSGDVRCGYRAPASRVALSTVIAHNEVRARWNAPLAPGRGRSSCSGRWRSFCPRSRMYVSSSFDHVDASRLSDRDIALTVLQNVSP